MAQFEPGALVLDVAAALRGEEFGPYKVVADAGPSFVHARPLGLGCGDEIVLAVEDLVMAHPELEALLRDVAVGAETRRRLRVEHARRDEERRIRASVRQFVDSWPQAPEARQ